MTEQELTAIENAIHNYILYDALTVTKARALADQTMRLIAAVREHNAHGGWL